MGSILLVGPEKRTFKAAAIRLGYSDDLEPVDSIFWSCDEVSALAAHLYNELNGTYTGVVATSESFMLTAALIRSLLCLPGPRFDDLLWARDKHVMRKSLSFRIRQPKIWRLGEVKGGQCCSSDLTVVKPVSGSACVGTFIHDFKSRQLSCDDLVSPMIVEEFIDAFNEYHVDGIWNGEEFEWVGVCRYDTPILKADGDRFSMSLLNSLPLYDEIVELATNVLSSNAPFPTTVHLEVLEDESGLVFGEVGLRPGGAHIAEMYREVLGVDLWAAHIQSQLGNNLNTSVKTPFDGVFGVYLLRRKLLQVDLARLEEVKKFPGVISVTIGEKAYRADVSTKSDALAFIVYCCASELEANRLVTSIKEWGDTCVS